MYIMANVACTVVSRDGYGVLGSTYERLSEA